MKLRCEHVMDEERNLLSLSLTASGSVWRSLKLLGFSIALSLLILLPIITYKETQLARKLSSPDIGKLSEALNEFNARPFKAGYHLRVIGRRMNEDFPDESLLGDRLFWALIDNHRKSDEFLTEIIVNTDWEDIQQANRTSQLMQLIAKKQNVER